MTGPSFNMEFVDAFTVGTVGPKGQRVFYIQARGEGELVSLKAEKQQVATLAQYLLGLLGDETTADVVDDAAFEPPEGPMWVIGAMNVEYSPDEDQLVLLAQELVDEDDEASDEPARARFHLSRSQALTFIRQAFEVVAAGRPPCQYCGRPLDDPEWCCCSN